MNFVEADLILSLHKTSIKSSFKKIENTSCDEIKLKKYIYCEKSPIETVAAHFRYITNVCLTETSSIDFYYFLQSEVWPLCLLTFYTERKAHLKSHFRILFLGKKKMKCLRCNLTLDHHQLCWHSNNIEIQQKHRWKYDNRF